MGKKQYERSLNSLKKQLKIHRDKLAKEKLKNTPDYGLINYWEKEIKLKILVNIEKAEKRLKRGK
jgi:hypothetical protein